MGSWPITIRGVTYASAAAAARAFGVTRENIYMARARGRLDSVGLGMRGNQHRARPVEICGMRFASVKQAAQAVGCHPETLSRHTRGGNPLGPWLRARFEALSAQRRAAVVSPEEVYAAAFARVAAAERAQHARVWK
jgi:hypothetical protein